MIDRHRLAFAALFIAMVLAANAQDKIYENTFALQDIKLLESPFQHARDLNIDVLLEYDVDRLLAPYLKEANLTPKAPSFPNWIALDGHVGGHYLTALAIHYAASGDIRCKERMEYMIAELKKCQDKHGNGYVGGVPNGANIWKEIENGNVGIVFKYWVPWYNLHKTYAGLRDAWLYGNNEQAKEMFIKLCDWGVNLIEKLSTEQMEAMLASEFGGMNEVYADAYKIAGDERYLTAAIRFSHKEIFDNMASKQDNLDNKHANTQVPKAVGYQRVAEFTQDKDYVTAANFFWETVLNNRSLAVGGNSRREHFPSENDLLSYIEEREGPESCNTNNMLKLVGGLFRMKPDVKYIDYYERAMYNHILSTQHPEHGGYVYFTSARPAHYRVYSQTNSAMWCCVGTGMENHGKYGELIYSHVSDSLYVNLFVPSELNWEEKDVKLIQQTSFPEEGNSVITVDVAKSWNFKILVRYPGWVPRGKMNISVAGVNYALNATPGSYVAIDRKWKKGDKIHVAMAMEFHVEELKNHPEYISIFRGPILMGAKVEGPDLHGLVAGDHRWGHIASGQLVSLFDTPILLGERDQLLATLNTTKAVNGESLKYPIPGIFVDSKFAHITLQPFYQIHDSRYMMYWLALSEKEFDSLQKEKQEEERLKLQLDKLTVDVVKLGEQQPEVDHNFKEHNTHRGIHDGQSWREADLDGYFTMDMQTSGKQELSLLVNYWGYESGDRTFDILIDDQILTTENLSNKWQQSRFFDVSYPIPQTLLKDRDQITVKFRPQKGNKAGRIFSVRLMEQ